jgi:single-strand DNA-binding protein
MNKVILMGRLTREPDIRYASRGDSQMAVARYTLAVDRRFRRNSDGGDQQSADFINCVAFDRQAEFAEKYLHQGTKIAVTGRIQTGSYVNREGAKVYTTDVVIEEQEFAESKAAASNYNAGQNFSSPNTSAPSRPAPSEAVGDGFMNIPDGVDDEGLPFN